ncbi:MAG: hypothetical protein KJ732_04150 [Candidatus Margulisbacteria bacterium]|nr:hypothetical protein [Candidatus Margulisiibacteriota bacterium]
MKKNIRLNYGISILCLLGLAWLIVGCGQTTTPAPTPTPTPSGSVTISGTLNTGNIASTAIHSAGVRAQATVLAALPDYYVVAVSSDTGQVYFPASETDASGNFSIPNLPNDESFFLEVIDSNYQLAAPVALGSTDGKVVMALDPGTTSTLDLDQIVLDTSKNTAAPASAPSGYYDLTASVEAKAGEALVPKGAGNFGKGSAQQYSGSYDPDQIDGDKDGLPNFFDADNNGDLVVDELDGLYTREAFILGAIADFFPYAFVNLKIDYDRRNTFNTGTDAYSDMTIAIGVTSNIGRGALSTKTISSVKVIEGPSWLSKATVISGGLWSATSYAVPAQGLDVFEVQVNGLKPLTDVNAGDALKFQVNYTDGTNDEAIKMLNFIFTDIPRVTAYKIGSGSWIDATAFPTAGPLSSASTSEVSLRWTRPKDETGVEINGGRYTWEYNAVGGGAREVEIISKDTSTAPSLEGTYLLGSLSDADFSAADFMIGVCIRSMANDNAAENVRFTKGW